MEKPVIDVVIGVIVSHGSVACVRQVNDKNTNQHINGESRDFLEGLWHLPGGKVGKDETLEVAVVREIYEEIGARVTVKELLGDHFEEREKAIIHLHWFHCIPHSMCISSWR
jgi:8-oxo-dGTP pyrophosphatase MutT (NUDIX family)